MSKRNHPSDGEIHRVNPANPKDLIGVFPFSKEVANQSVETAKKAFPTWRKNPDRWSYLFNFQKELRNHQDELAKTITREMGKPLWESQLEVKTAIDKISITQKQGLKRVTPFAVGNPKPNISAQCLFKPRGPLVVLGPFNFPLSLPLGHFIPALAVGNTVILKPSEHTPATGELLAKLSKKAKLPAGVFQVVQGNASIGKYLIKHEDIRGVLFTGSFAVGQIIQNTLLNDPRKICALEMGGKNSSLIWQDADLHTAIPHVLQSAMITTGQRCSSTSKLLVHKKLLRKVQNQIKKLAEKMVIGDPMKKDTFMGPLVHPKAKSQFLAKMVQVNKLGGKNLLSPRHQDFPKDSAFVEPQIHVMESFVHQTEYFDEELFGPDLALYPIQDFSQAIEIIESSRYGLAASIYTCSEKTFHNFLDQCTAGIINWNRPTTGASSSLPFGGQKASGNNFPSALFASDYCVYPVASLQDESGNDIDSYPGFPKDKER